MTDFRQDFRYFHNIVYLYNPYCFYLLGLTPLTNMSSAKRQYSNLYMRNINMYATWDLFYRTILSFHRIQIRPPPIVCFSAKLLSSLDISKRVCKTQCFIKVVKFDQNITMCDLQLSSLYILRICCPIGVGLVFMLQRVASNDKRGKKEMLYI